MIESCRCDRCRLVFSKGGKTLRLGYPFGYALDATEYLCPLCAEELSAWLNGDADRLAEGTFPHGRPGLNGQETDRR